MSLFTELMDEVLEQDPNLSLECFLSARRYIQIRWRALHGTPMPEDALTLFLADPSRGDLTEEQKSLARSSYEAVRRCYRRAAWDLLLYNQMLREGVVHDLREFRSLQRRRYAPGDSGRETRCEALCAPDLASPIPAPETGHEGV
ncbi:MULTISPECIES: hypothetical protein [Oscillospiraceae]|jgi:hypothetical protein|uniref:hypothetical protein n=1 Tax=Oscillospiraceae TaxID=216572 RepID=UPI000E64F2F0|nr:hypothetical protein [Dysosmobacter welbionis]MCQ5042295.1 hypothetical protein [Dysosmobacter welbionis]